MFLNRKEKLIGANRGRIIKTYLEYYLNIEFPVKNFPLFPIFDFSPSKFQMKYKRKITHMIMYTICQLCHLEQFICFIRTSVPPFVKRDGKNKWFFPPAPQSKTQMMLYIHFLTFKVHRYLWQKLTVATQYSFFPPI